MTDLLHRDPFGPRDDTKFLEEMVELTEFHRKNCPEYERIWPEWSGAKTIADIPYIHVSVFKHVALRTQDGKIRHERILNSSATTSGISSQIVLDAESSARQIDSSYAILADFIGMERRLLLILDDKSALLQRGGVSARISAALALRPFATKLFFCLKGQSEDATMIWERISAALDEEGDLLVYGFTWVLWFLLANGNMPDDIRERLSNRKVTYIHSGGWKKLEAQKVDRSTFNQTLTDFSGTGSKIVDYYGLVEQNGVVFPECEAGWRHVPVWADVQGRDTWTQAPVLDEPAQLQLMNLTPRGAPYHSVLTEDLGVVSETECPCGRSGRRFQLLGRLPKAELRGCANV